MQNDLKALVDEGIISPETAERIAAWYSRKRPAGYSVLLLVFGVLASLLVVSGILLLVAHNWDDFPKWLKTTFAFLPLAAGQLAAAGVLSGRLPAPLWKEPAGAWLSLSIGVCIALISQIYHLPGALDTFLLTWLVLGIPVVYVLSSGTAGLLYVAGSIWYVVEASYGWKNSGATAPGWPFWLLLLMILPFYLQLLRTKPQGWFAALFHILIPVSVLLGMGMFYQKNGYALVWPGYMALLLLLVLTGLLIRTRFGPARMNGYTFIGWLGIVGLLTAGTFREFWREIVSEYRYAGDTPSVWPVVITILLIIMAVAYWIFFHWRHRRPVQWHVLSPLVIVYPVLWGLAHAQPAAATLLGNVVMLYIAVQLMVMGNRQHAFRYLNAGLGMVAILAVSRFFDTDLSFILRGLIFIAVGTGFGIANYQLIKKKQSHG